MTQIRRGFGEWYLDTESCENSYTRNNLSGSWNKLYKELHRALDAPKSVQWPDMACRGGCLFFTLWCRNGLKLFLNFTGENFAGENFAGEKFSPGKNFRQGKFSSLAGAQLMIFGKNPPTTFLIQPPPALLIFYIKPNMTYAILEQDVSATLSDKI